MEMLTEEEKKQRRREYNKKYRDSAKGKIATLESTLRYQQTDEYKNRKREYYQRKKALESDQDK